MQTILRSATYNTDLGLTFKCLCKAPGSLAGAFKPCSGTYVAKPPKKYKLEEMIKSKRLMKLEEVGVFYQDRKTGEWFNGLKDGVDLTPYLLKACMFEH